MELPEKYHYEHRRRVEFSDTDLAGIVHFANYLRYVESAEHAFWRSLGMTVHSVTDNRQQGWPRLNISCNYFKPARFEQILEIRLHLKELKNTTIRYGFYIFDDHEPEPVLVAAGEVTIIHVALESHLGKIQKAPIPDDLRNLLEGVMAQ